MLDADVFGDAFGRAIVTFLGVLLLTTFLTFVFAFILTDFMVYLFFKRKQDIPLRFYRAIIQSICLGVLFYLAYIYMLFYIHIFMYKVLGFTAIAMLLCTPIIKGTPSNMRFWISLTTAISFGSMSVPLLSLLIPQLSFLRF
jgi:hypothetical protein